jgi:hypothetical protein
VAAGVPSSITALATGFFQAASAIVSRPDDPEPNQIGGGPFARVMFGGMKTNLASNVSGQSTSSMTNGSTVYSGFQAGFDVGVYNIDASAWNVNFGFMGGVANATTSASTSSPTPVGSPLLTTTQLQLSVPFVALYTFVSKKSFTAEVNVRYDMYSGNILSFNSDAGGFLVSPRTSLTGTGWSVNANVANRFFLQDWLYAEPLLGLNWGTYQFNPVAFSTGIGGTSSSINFAPIEIFLGRVGTNLGAAVELSDNVTLAPFIHGSIWHDFANPSTATAQVSGSGATVNFGVTADRIGTFGQVGAGINFKVHNVDLVGFARGDLLFGNTITGASFNIGLRKQF